MRASPSNRQASESERIYAMAREIHSDDLIDDDDTDSNSPTNHDWVTEANAWLEKANKEMQVALAQAERNLEKLEQMRLEVAKLTEIANSIESETKARKITEKQKSKKGFIGDVWTFTKAKYGMSYS